jgi:hypothetical protein
MEVEEVAGRKTKSNTKSKRTLSFLFTLSQPTQKNRSTARRRQTDRQIDRLSRKNAAAQFNEPKEKPKKTQTGAG